MIYDILLFKPIWKNGYNWDALLKEWSNKINWGNIPFSNVKRFLIKTLIVYLKGKNEILL